MSLAERLKPLITASLAEKEQIIQYMRQIDGNQTFPDDFDVRDLDVTYRQLTGRE